MGTHEYLNTHRYPHSGYPRGYGADTYIIFIQRGGDGYHTIRTHGYPLTSLAVSFLWRWQRKGKLRRPLQWLTYCSHPMTDIPVNNN